MQVYQPEFEEPWAQGLVSQHDPVTHIMEITMDQVFFFFFPPNHTLTLPLPWYWVIFFFWCIKLRNAD